MIEGLHTLDSFVDKVLSYRPPDKETLGSFWGRKKTLKYADLFCGIGGFHIAASNLKMECVFACDIDADCRKAYEANYGLMPKVDIRTTTEKDIPDIELTEDFNKYISQMVDLSLAVDSQQTIH